MHPADPAPAAARWAVILGGSSGFGLAAAHHLARAGFDLIIGHKDPRGVEDEVLAAEWQAMRDRGAQLATHNGNLADEEERGALLELIEARAGAGGVALLLHSIAAGSCKPLLPRSSQPTTQRAREDDARRAALDGLVATLADEGVTVDADTLDRATQRAFHERGCDALHTLARSRIPHRDDELGEDDLARTIAMMGTDYLLWGRELARCGLLAPGARLIGLTSQGSAIAWSGYGAVSIAKAALEAACRAMALELAPHDVRCCIVQAGITDTPAGNAIPDFDRMKARARLKSPLGRLTTPDDVAAAIVALAQQGFAWANGCVIRVDGGEAIVGD